MTGFQQGIKDLLSERAEVMRTVVRGLDAAALNWMPFAEDGRTGSNSIAQLLSHALDAERSLVGHVAGLHLPRDRESHFRIEFDRAEALLELIDDTERAVAGYVDRIPIDRLADNVRIVEPTWPVPDVTRPGSYWLLHAIEHASEHIGQAMLTRQMYDERC